MSKIGVRLKIDVSKIDKTLLFKGDKGTYLDATVFINPNEADQYGNNGMITQDQTKENRDAGINGPILGNCKVFWRDDGTPQQPARQAAQPEQQEPQMGDSALGPDDFDDSDLPF